MPNGSNCALNHEAQLNSSGCANDMLAIHYIGDIREWQ